MASSQPALGSMAAVPAAAGLPPPTVPAPVPMTGTAPTQTPANPAPMAPAPVPPAGARPPERAPSTRIAEAASLPPSTLPPPSMPQAGVPTPAGPTAATAPTTNVPPEFLPPQRSQTPASPPMGLGPAGVPAGGEVQPSCQSQPSFAPAAAPPVSRPPVPPPTGPLPSFGTIAGGGAPQAMQTQGCPVPAGAPPAGQPMRTTSAGPFAMRPPPAAAPASGVVPPGAAFQTMNSSMMAPRPPPAVPAMATGPPSMAQVGPAVSHGPPPGAAPVMMSQTPPEAPKISKTEADALLAKKDQRPWPGDLPLVRQATLRDDIVSAVVPWLVFLIIALVFTFLYHVSSAGFLIVFVALVVLAFVWSAVYPLLEARWPDSTHQYVPLSGLQFRDWGPRQFAVMALAVFVGALVGYYNYCTGVRAFYDYHALNKYTNVWPDESAAAHSDAAAIVFAHGTKPDVGRAAGFVAGRHEYCAAPIRMSGEVLTAAPIVQYWAVGRDCCPQQTQLQTSFTCGDVDNSDARAGITVFNRTNLYDFLIANEAGFYRRAIDQSAALYGLAAAKDALMLEWSADIDYSNQWRVWKALLFLLVVSLLIFPCFVMFSFGPSRIVTYVRSTAKRFPAGALQAKMNAMRAGMGAASGRVG